METQSFRNILKRAKKHNFRIRISFLTRATASITFKIIVFYDSRIPYYLTVVHGARFRFIIKTYTRRVERVERIPRNPDIKKKKNRQL